MEIVQETGGTKIRICDSKYKKTEPLHWHSKYEICQLMSNKCRFLVNGTYIDAKKGDFVAIGTNVIHRFIVEEEAEVQILQFPLKVLIDFGVPIKELNKHITIDEIREISGLEQKIKMLLTWIEEEQSAITEGDDVYQQHLIATFYCLLLKYFEDMSADDISKEQQEFLKIIQYIKEHFEEDININALSEKLCIYRAKLSAIFKKYAGMSPNEYIHFLRVKKADELMNQGYDVTEAALESGFRNIKTFNNVYKKVTGITPTEYKKRSALAK